MSGENLKPFDIPNAVWCELFSHSRKAFPAECCGYLIGNRHGEVTSFRPCENAQQQGQHPSQSDRTAETAYVIAGSDLLALTKSFDTEAPALIIYHSHPNGRAYFSATDQEAATSPWGDGPAYPVQHLVIGIDGEAVRQAALFAWSDAESKFVEIKRWDEPALSQFSQQRGA